MQQVKIYIETDSSSPKATEKHLAAGRNRKAKEGQ